jgi:hypothetical protein
MTDAELDFTARLNKAMGLAQQEAIATELDNAAYYIERNANAKILFHALTIKMAVHIVKNNVRDRSVKRLRAQAAIKNLYLQVGRYGMG